MPKYENVVEACGELIGEMKEMPNKPYRPKGWEKTLREILDSFGVTYMNSEECKLIEAGADAMLEKLIEESKKPKYRNGRKGINVFIPDSV